jgi:hypothetical protein
MPAGASALLYAEKLQSVAGGSIENQPPGKSFHAERADTFHRQIDPQAARRWMPLNQAKQKLQNNVAERL